MRIKLLGALALSSMVAVGCGPPSVEDVSGAVRKTVELTAAQAGSSTSAMEGMTQLSDLATVASAGLMPLDALPPMRPSVQLPSLKLPSTAMNKLVPTHDAELIATGEKIAAFLETRIFTEENVEERTGDAVIFRITGEDVCSDGTTPAEPACVASFDNFEVRLRATRPNNSILVTLLVGPNRDEPFSFQMSETFVAFTGNLAEIRETIIYVSNKTGGELIGLPQTMEGVIELRATRGTGEHDFTLSQSILSAVTVQYTDAEGSLWSLQAAAGNDITRFEFIEAESRIRLALNVTQLDYSFPNTFYIFDEATGTNTPSVAQMDVRMGGASFALDTHDGATELLVSNIGLGEVSSFIKVDGVQVASVDINSASGRHFDLHLQRDLAARPVFQVRSQLNVAVALNYSPMEAHGATVPEWARQDNLSVSFTGGTGGPSYRHEPYNEAAGFPGGERVLDGTLVLSTDEPGVTPVTVAAGQCLVSQTQYDELGNPIEGHPFQVHFSSVACP